MKNEPKLPNCTIEKNMNFTVIGKVKTITPDSKTTLYVEMEEAKIHCHDEKHVIKTFSDATLIDEISRRYNVDLIINHEKDNR